MAYQFSRLLGQINHVQNAILLYYIVNKLKFLLRNQFLKTNANKRIYKHAVHSTLKKYNNLAYFTNVYYARYKINILKKLISNFIFWVYKVQVDELFYLAPL